LRGVNLRDERCDFVQLPLRIAQAPADLDLLILV